MDNGQHDKKFFKSFSMVMAALLAITFLIAIAANVILEDDDAIPAEFIAKMEERVAPVGKVITDPAALVKVSAKVEREPKTAKEVVDTACVACHSTGVLNAPKIGDKAAWAARMTSGMKVVVANAINGKGAMPAKGGDPSLSDAEVEAAVKLMLKDSGL